MDLSVTAIIFYYIKTTLFFHHCSIELFLRFQVCILGIKFIIFLKYCVSKISSCGNASAVSRGKGDTSTCGHLKSNLDTCDQVHNLVDPRIRSEYYKRSNISECQELRFTNCHFTATTTFA